MAECIKCPNSNLRFYGTKLDRYGNDSAVFDIPNHRKFLIQQVSMGMGSKGWYSGSRSAMDADTFLAKNPDITIEDLERGAIEYIKEEMPSLAKRVSVRNVSDSKNNKDMKRVKDEIQLSKNGNGKNDIGIGFKYKGDRKLNKSEVDELDKVVKDWSKDKFGENIFDSQKIKDAEETPDVLDGILMIAFNDGSEDEGYKEVQKHANEQGELDGVQYETYDTDNQDGVTLIDLCAATDDANAFVKALLNEWGIIDEVADIEFEKSELMENAEVSDSKKIKDSQSQYQQKYEEIARLIESKMKDFDLTDTQVRKILRKKGLVLYKTEGTHYEYWAFMDDNTFDNVSTIEMKKVGIWLEEQYITDDFYVIGVGLASEEGKGVPEEALADSRKVEDMTKPAHLRGYAEKKRKQRREQREENNDEETKQEVNDSRRVSDSLEDDYEEYLNEIGEGLDEDEFIIGGKKRNMPYGTALRKYDPIAFNVGFDEWEREMEDDKEQILGQIATQLEEGYHSGYDPQWDIDITVDNGMDISDFSDEDKDLIYQNIAYVVKDGYDNYMDIETELSDGSIVYVDFVLNY